MWNNFGKELYQTCKAWFHFKELELHKLLDSSCYSELESNTLELLVS